MEYPVWCLMVDGPMAGKVYELDVTARAIQIPGTVEEPGSHCYRRIAWATGDAHRIALWKHTKTLVV